MNNSEFVLDYEVKRNIKIIDIEANMCAYREEMKIGTEDVQVSEGIINKEQLSSLKYGKPLDVSNYGLYAKDFLEYHRKYDFFKSPNMYELQEQYKINNPYSYIIENGLDNVKIVYVYFGNQQLYAASDKKYPKMVPFYESEGAISSKFYDLDTALEILRKRNDVELIIDDIVDSSAWHSISNGSHYLKFNWIPSDEDWIKYSSVIEDLFKYDGMMRHNGASFAKVVQLKYEIANNVLGLCKARINGEAKTSEFKNGYDKNKRKDKTIRG